MTLDREFHEIEKRLHVTNLIEEGVGRFYCVIVKMGVPESIQTSACDAAMGCGTVAVE